MLKYYPSFRVKTDLVAKGEFLLDGKPYSGKYYQTFDGQYFTGPNPIFGPNEQLVPKSIVQDSPGFTQISIYGKQVNQSSEKKGSNLGAPTSYFPYPTTQDYSKGYFMRYFLKKVNQSGYITEVSPSEYGQFKNGLVNYDVSMYLSAELMWKITGPIKTVRLSQYDIRAGIVDTNQRLVENLEKTFIGIKEFINFEYEKYSRPTK